MNRWKRRARALAALADDQRGKPEGEVARQKLLEMLNKYPQAREYEPILALAKKDMTLREVGEMKRQGISLAGKWEGSDLQHSIALMIADYQQRIANHKARPFLLN
jgi:hypothetical protein